MTKLVDTSAGTDRLEFHIDSTFIFNELRVLEGKNFDKVFHSSTYDIKISPLQITYQRKNGENKGPLSLKIEKTYKDSIKSVELVETEENILFTSKKRSLYEFDPMNRIHSYSIDSYQKIIGLDPYEFRIKGKIAPTSDLE